MMHKAIMKWLGGARSNPPHPIDPDAEFTQEQVATLIEAWIKRRGERGDSPDKEGTRKVLYEAVDKLIEQVYRAEPQFENGEFESLKIDLGIAGYDDEDNALSSIVIERSSQEIY